MSLNKLAAVVQQALAEGRRPQGRRKAPPGVVTPSAVYWWMLFEKRPAPLFGNAAMSRVTVDPRQMNGVPCIRGLRIPVATVVGMVAEGMTQEDILRTFPDLQAEDVHAALAYAAEAVRERELPLLHAS
jgi:uncharacterized protein (DUF433 family)